MSSNNKSNTSEEQLKFASVLQTLSIIGLLYIVLSFFLYVLGVLPSFFGIDRVSSYWHLPLDEYINITHIPTGWDWIYLMAYSDIIAFSSIVFLATIVTIAFLIVLPSYIKKRDILALIIIAEIVVLLLAASGIFSPGH